MVFKELLVDSDQPSIFGPTHHTHRHTYKHTTVHTPTHTYTHLYTCTHIYTHTYTHYTHLYTPAHTPAHTPYTYLHTPTHTPACTHLHAHTLYTYTHIYTQTCTVLSIFLAKSSQTLESKSTGTSAPSAPLTERLITPHSRHYPLQPPSLGHPILLPVRRL